MSRDPRMFRAARKSWVATHGCFVSRKSRGSRPTDVSWRERVMGRGPRMFRAAKQSWIATHGCFMPRNSHGSRSTDVSWRERVMGRDPRMFRDTKQSWAAIHGYFTPQKVHGAPHFRRNSVSLGIFLKDLRRSAPPSAKNAQNILRACQVLIVSGVIPVSRRWGRCSGRAFSSDPWLTAGRCLKLKKRRGGNRPDGHQGGRRAKRKPDRAQPQARRRTNYGLAGGPDAIERR
jgi:hypothetical protein